MRDNGRGMFRLATPMEAAKGLAKTGIYGTCWDVNARNIINMSLSVSEDGHSGDIPASVITSLRKVASAYEEFKKSVEELRELLEVQVEE